MQRFSRSPSVLLEQSEPMRCPLCQAPLAVDDLGLVECGCGWAGPGDPLERAHGVRRALLRLDRRAAARLADPSSRRRAHRPAHPLASGSDYLLLVLAASVVTYLVVGLIWLRVLAWTVEWTAEGAVVGMCIGVSFLALLAVALVGERRRQPGIEANSERFPRLFTALDEVEALVQVPESYTVLLTPGVEVSVRREWKPKDWRHPRIVLRVGAAALPLLTEVELKALLLRELAFHVGGMGALLRFSERAESLLARLISTLFASVQPERTTLARSSSRVLADAWTVGSMCLVLGFPVVWVLTLPLRLWLTALHLLRLPQSYAAALAADAVAIRVYGAPALANGATALLVADSTVRGALPAIRADMLEHGQGDFYAALARHYAALPVEAVRLLRRETLTGFRSLRHQQPLLADRLRAANLSGRGVVAPALAHAEPVPALDLFRPAGDADAGAVELALTALLLATQSPRRQRRWWQRQ